MAMGRHCDRQDASHMSTQERRKKDMATDAARATHAHGYKLNDGYDGTNAAAALVTASAVILYASGMLDVTAMDAIIIAMLAAVMTPMLHASCDCTYGMRHDENTMRKAQGRHDVSQQVPRVVIDRCCAYCLYILLWTGAAMLYVLGESGKQGMLPTAVTLLATLTAFVAMLAARRHESDTMGDVRR